MVIILLRSPGSGLSSFFLSPSMHVLFAQLGWSKILLGLFRWGGQKQHCVEIVIRELINQSIAHLFMKNLFFCLFWEEIYTEYPCKNDINDCDVPC